MKIGDEVRLLVGISPARVGDEGTIVSRGKFFDFRVQVPRLAPLILVHDHEIEYLESEYQQACKILGEDYFA